MDYQPSDIVQFPYIHSNIGLTLDDPTYDPSTGIFTCPLHGYYTFSVTIYKASNPTYDEFSVYLRKSEGGRVSTLDNYYSCLSLDYHITYR